MSGSVPSPRVSIVVRCYNEADHIGMLLGKLKRQTFSDYEVVVVDSGSTDGTLEIVTSADVMLEHIGKEEFSFGRSLNIGCHASRGEILVFISAHCYPEHDDWLENLVAGFADDNVAIVYGRQRAGQGSHFSEGQIFRQWFPDESQPRQEGPFSNNANCAIRRDLWAEYPYDESLTGLEDIAWAQRVIRDGWWVSYRADAGVIHIHDESDTQIRNRYRREAITFQTVFPEEHFNVWDFLRLLVRNVMADWRAVATGGGFRVNLWPIVRFRLAQFAGTYQGFHSRRPVTSELKRRLYYPEGSR